MVRARAGGRTDSGEDSGEAAAGVVEHLGRFGYAAKGVVYILVGLLGVQAAFTARRAAGADDALRVLFGGPLQRVLLGAIAVGLAGYVLWQAVAALANPENEGIGKRGFRGVVAFLYGALAWQAARIALGGVSPDSTRRATEWAATVMEQPFGRWMVGAAGLVIGGFGIQQVYKGYKADLSEELQLDRLGATARRWTVRTARLGIGLRGLIFIVAGGLVVLAAVHGSPGTATGLGGAMRVLERQPLGAWIVGILALGVIAYGVYYLVKSRYREMDVD